MEGLPASNRFDLVGAGKAVTAVEADANGARLVCGSHDYKCYLYDFGGLKADGKSFRSWEVSVGPCGSAAAGRVGLCGPARSPCFAAQRAAFCIPVPSRDLSVCAGTHPAVIHPAAQVTEGYPVVAVSWSPTGDAFLVVTSYSQVCSRQGAGCAGAGHHMPQAVKAFLVHHPGTLLLEEVHR